MNIVSLGLHPADVCRQFHHPPPFSPIVKKFLNVQPSNCCSFPSLRMKRIFMGLHPADVCRQFHHPPPFSSVPSQSNQNFPVITKGFCISIDTLHPLWFMLLCFLLCFLVINLSFFRGCTRTISTNLCFFLVYQLNIFPFNFCFVNYSVFYKSKAEALEHTNKRDTGHQSVSLENKTGDSTMLKIGDSTKVVIKQDMKGRRHKYGFNNNKRSPPASTPPPPPPPPPPSPPPPPPTLDASTSPSAVKRTRKASRLRSLSTRPPGAERPVVHVDPAIGKADGPHRKKLRTYLGIVTRDKVDITYENWKEVPTAQKDLIWEDIQAEFDIPEASDSRTKGKLLQTVGERWRQFKSDLTRKWALAADQDGVEDTVCDKYGISKEKWAQFCQTRRDPSWEKLLAEKTKRKLQEAAQSGSVDGVIDPPSPEMTTEATKEIAEKIVSHFQLTITIMFEYFENVMYHCVFSVQDSFEEQATQGSFVPHGRQDVLVAAIGRPEHPGLVRAAGAGVTIKQYFGSTPRTSRNASSLPPDELQQLTQQIRDQLEESITEKVTRQMQSQGLAVPPEPLVGPGPSGPRLSTKGSCVDPSGNDPETGDSDRCGLYIEADPARLVAMGRVYEGSTVVHNTPLLPGQVKVSVEEVTDADAPVPVPTDEVSLVGQTLHTFLAWLTHLVKSLSQQVAVSPPKPPPKPDPEVNDPLYLMTLTIPELFLRPYQVRWDATVFGVVNPDFPLYIKHKDLFEIAHSGQCLSISSIQRSGQSQFESESYIKSWMQSSQHDYLGAYLNGGHWQMVVILPKEHLVVWFCSLHNRPDTLRGLLIVLSRVLMMLHSLNQRLLLGGLSSRQKGSTECGYYVMHWMSTIILGTFRNNWEAYFNDPRPLEPERLKALRIQWAQFYLRVRDQT
ncbi:hypothetical protein HKD37_19G052969 [Glycine soja]